MEESKEKFKRIRVPKGVLQDVAIETGEKPSVIQSRWYCKEPKVTNIILKKLQFLKEMEKENLQILSQI